MVLPGGGPMPLSVAIRLVPHARHSVNRRVQTTQQSTHQRRCPLGASGLRALPHALQAVPTLRLANVSSGRAGVGRTVDRRATFQCRLTHLRSPNRWRAGFTMRGLEVRPCSSCSSAHIGAAMVAYVVSQRKKATAALLHRSLTRYQRPAAEASPLGVLAC
jgi:hypothetical protein